MTGYFRRKPRHALWLIGAVLAGTSCSEDKLAPTDPTAPTDIAAATAATELSFYQVSGGSGSHSCGVTTTNQAYCWGTGYLGDGPSSSSKRTTPVAVTGGHQFRLISAGWDYTCALTTDNRAYCWGLNYAGQLGDGSTTDRPTPVPAASHLRFRQISAAHQTTCGLTTENRVYCWGNSGSGMMGTGSSSASWGNPPAEIAGGRTYNQVSSAFNHSCALTFTSEIYCWGRNDYGQLGDSSSVRQRNAPVRVSGARVFKNVSTGRDVSCGVTTTNRAFCWGYNGDGQIGDGSTLNRWEPRQVAGTVLFERVTVGGSTTCAESTSNQAYCWGYGGLGNGTTNGSTRPVAVAGGHWFAQLSSGNAWTCGVTPEQRGYCWGANGEGALGDGTTTDRLEPTPIAAAS